MRIQQVKLEVTNQTSQHPYSVGSWIIKERETVEGLSGLHRSTCQSSSRALTAFLCLSPSHTSALQLRGTLLLSVFHL